MLLTPYALWGTPLSPIPKCTCILQNFIRLLCLAVFVQQHLEQRDHGGNGHSGHLNKLIPRLHVTATTKLSWAAAEENLRALSLRHTFPRIIKGKQRDCCPGPPSMENNNFSLAFVKSFFPRFYSSTLSLGQLRMPSGLSMMNLLL